MKGAPTKKEIYSWSLYDFANSAYAGLVPTLLFPLYYKNILLQNNPHADIWWGVAAGISILLAGFLAPTIGAWADYTRKRKLAFILATLVAVVGTGALAFSSQLSPLLATLLFLFTNMSFNIALTMYDSLLFNVSTTKNSGHVSCIGWSLGFVGGLLCTALVYPFLKKGINDPLYVTSFFLVAVFYLVFSIPSFLYVKETKLLRPEKTKIPIRHTFKRIFETIRNWRKYKHLLYFLVAFYFFSEGIVTLWYFGAIYANTTLGFTQTELAILLASVQIVAIPATLLVGKKSDHIPHRKILIGTLIVWCVGTLLLAWVTTKAGFYAAMLLIGLIIGGSQATARAWYNNIIPPEKRSELFGFNALASKVSTTIGPPIFGLLSVWTGSQRIAMLSVFVYFLISLVLFVRIKK